MKGLLLAALAAVVGVLLGCGQATHSEHLGSPDRSAGIQWFQGEVEQAFAAARTEGRPLFLYWGADWCPPCHNLKRNVFAQEEFLEAVGAFVPVYLDGDSERAQLWGERFGISGYPTVILFSPSGAEIYRMPTDVTVERYGELLKATVSEFRPVHQIVQEVMEDGPRTADPLDLELIAFHSWSQDPHESQSQSESLDTFWRLYEQSRPELERVRLRFMTLVLDSVLPGLSAAQRGYRDGPPAELDDRQRDSLRAGLLDLLGNPDLWSENKIFLTLRARQAISVLEPEPSAARDEVVEAWRSAAVEMQGHPDFTASEQLYAFVPEFEMLSFSEDPAAQSVPLDLQEKVRGRVDVALAEMAEPGELQTVLNMLVWLLMMADLEEEAESLLEARLDDAAAPHYFLSLLADLSADNPETALKWHRLAFERSGRGSSRLKWGSTYVQKLIELTPEDAVAVESASRGLVSEIMASDDAFAGRNFTYLQGVDRALISWAGDGPEPTVVLELRDEVREQCGRFEDSPDAPQHQRCMAFLGAAVPAPG